MELDAAALAALYATLDADVAATVASFELPSIRLQATQPCEPAAALYFWIRSEDHAVGRFDRVWVILQG